MFSLLKPHLRPPSLIDLFCGHFRFNLPCYSFQVCSKLGSTFHLAPAAHDLLYPHTAPPPRKKRRCFWFNLQQYWTITQGTEGAWAWFRNYFQLPGRDKYHLLYSAIIIVTFCNSPTSSIILLVSLEKSALP